jgi:hypothetical protein
MLAWTSFPGLLAEEVVKAEDKWADVFFGLDQEKRFVLVIVAIGCATGIIISAVAIITGLSNSVYRRRTETHFKQELLDRGMSADEIAKIVESSAPQDGLDRWIASWGKKKHG